jgi:hypothetical protein
MIRRSYAAVKLFIENVFLSANLDFLSCFTCSFLVLVQFKTAAWYLIGFRCDGDY